jgi:hypothetical protein
MDFKKAYDSIERNKLYQAMKKLKIPKKLIGLTRMTLTDTQNKISAVGRLPESFGEKIGVRQGEPLSTMLFNIVLEAVFRDSEIHTQGKEEIEKAFSTLEKAAEGYGLRINEEQTKYPIIKQEITTDEPYSMFRTETKSYNFERVEHFDYLGVTVSDDNEE